MKYNGQPKALKVYKPAAIRDPKAFYQNLENNVSRGSPSSAFLWPEDILPAKKGPEGVSFGYIMDLRPGEYQELSAFFAGAVKFSSFLAAVDASIQITSAFRILHSKGYSYQDLNDGNFFINPQTGKVMICDNDNVAPNGTKTGILGKPRYMAPEIVRGEAMPSTNTDRFSLAVVIFMMLTMSHPLEGSRYLVPCLTPEVELQLYGTEPIFILDPNDKRNAPVRGVHKNIGMVWPELPDYMRAAFTKAFTNPCLHDPNRRITEQEWEELLMRLRSDIIHCSCGNDNLSWEKGGLKCSACGKPFGKFRTLKMSGCDYVLPLIPGNVVYRAQLGTANVDEAGKPVIRIVMNPADRSMHMQNVSGREMECITPTGRRVPVPSGTTAPANPGLALRLSDGMVTVL